MTIWVQHNPRSDALRRLCRSMSLRAGQLQRGEGSARRGRVPADHVNRCWPFLPGWCAVLPLQADTSQLELSCADLLCRCSSDCRTGGLIMYAPAVACRLMRCNFSVMRRLGDRVLRPFLQVILWQYSATFQSVSTHIIAWSAVSHPYALLAMILSMGPMRHTASVAQHRQSVCCYIIVPKRTTAMCMLSSAGG